MKICLISSEDAASDSGRFQRSCAELLATRHEVTLIHTVGAAEVDPIPRQVGVHEIVAKPSADLARTVFCADDQRWGAAVLEAIESAYGSDGPDYIEAPDHRAHGLVTLQAKRCGHPLLQGALFATQIGSSAELALMHDGTLERPDAEIGADLERAQMRLSDRLVWRGGDILDLYDRYYPFAFPPAFGVKAPLDVPSAAPVTTARSPREPLKILCVSELRRGKGSLDLAEACLRLPADGWRLTMLGADTTTAPMGQSVRAVIEAMCGDDPRIDIAGPVSLDELRQRLAGFDLLVVPSRFEAWSGVALEAMRAGLPIVATPVGGLAEIVAPGITGWHADGVGPEAVRSALERVLGDRQGLERMRASGAIFERFRQLTDPQGVLEGYERLFESANRPDAGAGLTPVPGEPSVTAIIPYYHAPEYIEEAVGSVLGQTHRNVDVLIVNDGSFADDDDLLDRLAADPRVAVVTQLNSGEPSARNLGAAVAGSEYVVMLDADNVLEPEFVARAVEIFRREPELVYVSCWLRFVAPDGSPVPEPAGYAPLGNEIMRDDINNSDGDALAILPRGVFSELGYRYEPTSGLQSDWELYRCLREDGRFGVVIPERLARYRMDPGSLMRSHTDQIHRRSWEEARARRKLRSTRWTAEVAGE